MHFRQQLHWQLLSQYPVKLPISIDLKNDYPFVSLDETLEIRVIRKCPDSASAYREPGLLKYVVDFDNGILH
tara:strand:- start:361 stop:576 length:216 start_codon:yes stop_codon:yes gene_type:complete